MTWSKEKNKFAYQKYLDQALCRIAWNDLAKLMTYLGNTLIERCNLSIVALGRVARPKKPLLKASATPFYCLILSCSQSVTTRQVVTPYVVKRSHVTGSPRFRNYRS